MEAISAEELRAIYDRWKRTGTITPQNVERLREDFWNLYKEVCRLKEIPIPWHEHVE